MNIRQPWADALNVSPDKLTDWSAQAPADRPLLTWCLNQDLISWEDYLEWARNHYELPAVESSFFVEAVDAEFVKAQISSDSQQWQPWCFPIAVWDGITFVACAEPPEQFFDEHTRLVLADPRILETFFTQTRDVTPPSLPSIDAPIGVDLTQGTKFTLNLDGATLMTEDPSHVAPHHPATEAPPPPPPLGGADENEPPTLSVLKVGEFTEIGKTPPPPAIQVQREETSFTHLTSISAKHPIEELSEVSHSGISRTGISRTGISFPPRALYTLPALEKVSLPKDEDGAIQAAFEHILKEYTHACIFKITGDSAKLYRWDKSLNPKKEGVEISISEPSFLRIVSKTQSPYHGYLLSAVTHDHFIKVMNLDATPGCVTAVALNVAEKNWGFLVAMGHEGLQSLEYLQTVEAMANQLAATLTPIWSQAS